MGNYLFLLLILACPLLMIFMMRGHGGHGGKADRSQAHGDGHSDRAHAGSDPSSSLDELRRQREQLDRAIEEQEAEEQAPVGGGWR